MISLAIFVSLFVIGMAQRPSYAGSQPIRYPDLASRFKGDSASSSATPVLEDRFGEGGTTQKLPVDARGDAQLVNRLNKWPENNRPFWLLNAEQIEQHRGGSNVVPVNANPNQKSSSGQSIQDRKRLPERQFRTIQNSNQQGVKAYFPRV